MTGAPTAADRLPAGTRLLIGEEVWRYDGRGTARRRGSGATLVGGAPVRVMKLTAAAAALIDDRGLTVDDDASARLGERLLDAGIAHPDPASLPPGDLDELTVVIPVHGRPAQLARLLDALHGVRVLVVDDGTPEPAAAALAAAVSRAGAELVRLDENAGPATARNRGLQHSGTAFVAFVDSDVVLAADDLERMLRHFADPRLAVVGPRVAGIAADPTWISRYENARSSVDLGRRPALVRPRSPVSWISSTCIVGRREALAAGFTDGMRVAEDVDLVWRLAEAGWRVRYEPSVTVTHEHRRRLRPWFARKLFYGTGAADLADRHPDAIPPAILRPWSAAVAAVLLCARWWSLPAAALITAVTAWRLGRRLGTSRDAPMLPVRLAVGGVVGAMTQVSALALRHWWPIGLAAAVVSRRFRWIVAGMAVIDAVVEHRRLRADLDIARFALLRRLDDIAYGTGVWWGALRRGSLRALRVELRPRREAGGRGVPPRDAQKGGGAPGGAALSGTKRTAEGGRSA